MVGLRTYWKFVNNKKWEVDEFLGNNKGLFVAEIELTSEDESFQKPSWIGKEVTNDHRYRNSYLAKTPITEWSEVGNASIIDKMI